MLKYREFLKSGLERYFDIQEDYELGNCKFELYASFNQKNSKYIFLKSIEVYAFNSNEYIFLRKLDESFKMKDLNWVNSFLNENLHNILDNEKDHMSSVITFLFEAPMPSEDIQKKLSKFKYYKSFFFGIRGWVNVKIMLIDPTLRSGITNKIGKGDLERFIIN